MSNRRLMVSGYIWAVFLFLSISSGCLQWIQRPDRDLSAYGYVEIKGSDTLVNLNQLWAEVFMEENEDTYISVTGGGSGTGIAALINDNTDIAASSREMKETEIEIARERGVTVWGFSVAIDALAVVVNRENPVDELTLSQLEAIFTGKIVDWSELGWEEGGGISVYSRQSNSGTYVFFNEAVMGGEDWAEGTKFLSGSASINDAIKTDRAAIGYYGVGYIENVKPLIVSENEGSEGSSPLDLDAVSSGRYPLARPLFFYINGEPKGTVLDFLIFVLSKEGQSLVLEEEYYSIGEDLISLNEEILDKARGAGP